MEGWALSERNHQCSESICSIQQRALNWYTLVPYNNTWLPHLYQLQPKTDVGNTLIRNCSPEMNYTLGMPPEQASQTCQTPIMCSHKIG